VYYYKILSYLSLINVTNFFKIHKWNKIISSIFYLRMYYLWLISYLGVRCRFWSMIGDSVKDISGKTYVLSG